MFRLFSVATICFVLVSCSGGGGAASEEPEMRSSLDSMSYVMGMNIALNIIEVDSTINADMVCMGIRDIFAGEPKLNDEQARTAFLKYMNYDEYERIKHFEERFLADLRNQDRKFYATTSGLTYKIQSDGDNKRRVKNNRDTVKVCFRVLNSAGDIIDTTYYRNDTLRIGLGSMPRGLQEASKLVGQGGHIEAWLPSSLAYGSEGCDSLNIAPNTMLYYEMTIVEVEKTK